MLRAPAAAHSFAAGEATKKFRLMSVFFARLAFAPPPVFPASRSISLAWKLGELLRSARASTRNGNNHIMKLKLIACLFLLSAVCLRADSISGNIKLTYSDSPFSENVFKKDFARS